MILNADVRHVLPILPSDHVDMIFTDPPYSTISGGSGHSATHQRPTGMLAKNDGRIFKHNDIQPREYMGDLFRVLKPGGHMYLMTNFLNLEMFLSECRSTGFGIHNLLIWVKNNATPNRWYMKNVEYVILARKGAARQINDCGSKTAHHFDNIIGDKTHPTEKPVDLIRFYIENSSQAGDIVLDPFMGTGAAGVACRTSDRKFIGLEIDKTHFDVAVDRIGHDLLRMPT